MLKYDILEKKISKLRKRRFEKEEYKIIKVNFSIFI